MWGVIFLDIYVVVVNIFILPWPPYFYLYFAYFAPEWKVFLITISVNLFVSCLIVSYLLPFTSNKLILVVSMLFFYWVLFWGVWWSPKLKLITFGVFDLFLDSIKLKRNYFFVSVLCDLLLTITYWLNLLGSKCYFSFSLFYFSSS